MAAAAAVVALTWSFSSRASMLRALVDPWLPDFASTDADTMPMSSSSKNQLFRCMKPMLLSRLASFLSLWY